MITDHSSTRDISWGKGSRGRLSVEGGGIDLHNLAELSRTARARGDEARAGRLWGAIEAEEARAPLGRWEQYRDELEASLVNVAEPDFELGRDEGRTLALDDAVAIALETGDA